MVPIGWVCYFIFTLGSECHRSRQMESVLVQMDPNGMWMLMQCMFVFLCLCIVYILYLHFRIEWSHNNVHHLQLYTLQQVHRKYLVRSPDEWQWHRETGGERVAFHNEQSETMWIEAAMCQETLKSLLSQTNLDREHVPSERDNPSSKHQFRIPELFCSANQRRLRKVNTTCNASPIGSMYSPEN